MNETKEVVATRTIKGWSNEFTIQVVKDQDWLWIEETHTGNAPDKHCAKVSISRLRMGFTWIDRRGTVKASEGFSAHIPLFKAAEDRFITLLGQHLRKEYRLEKFSPNEWVMVHRVIKDGLSQFIPEKETEELIAKYDKEAVLGGLKRTRTSANIRGYSHIAEKLTQLIEEVKNK